MTPLRLAVLDVDGTLKQAESPYQYVHERLGFGERGEHHRQLALAGKIPYAEWLRLDVELWAGQPVARLRQILAENPYVPGAPELLRALKAAGVTVALVSAGFTLNTDPIMAEFGLDRALANQLVLSDEHLSGEAVHLVPEGGKGAFVRALMAELGATPEETLAAGDTRGDLELFACAGVRMAVNPRCQELRDAASIVLEPTLEGAIAWLIAQGHLPPRAGR